MVCGSAGKAFVVSRHCVYSITSVYFSFVGKEEPSSINRVTFVKSCCITLRLHTYVTIATPRNVREALDDVCTSQEFLFSAADFMADSK